MLSKTMTLSIIWVLAVFVGLVYAWMRGELVRNKKVETPASRRQPREGLKSFMCRVHVRLPEPMQCEDEKIVGYYQNHALNAEDGEDAKRLIEAQVNLGAIDWSDSEIRELDLEQLDPIISRRWNADRGVWYRSGRMFYPAEPS